MADAVSQAIESVPGYGLAMDGWNEYAGDKLQTKDPFYVKEQGKETRRKPPPGITGREEEIWKHIIDMAWTHDRCFCGCFWFDLGLGSTPLVALIPIIGPLTMYVVHGRLVSVAEEARIPAQMHTKMAANITFDFLISIVPILGAIFAWMNACSTRNAAMFDTWLRHRGEQMMTEMGPFQQVQAPSKKDKRTNSRGVKVGQQQMGVL